MKSLAWTGLACLLMGSPLGFTKNKGHVELAKGAKVGIVNLMDSKVMHYHSARHSNDDFMKVYTVHWPVGDMLNEAIKEEFDALGLIPVPVAPSHELLITRQDCFVEAPLVKGIPKECSQGLVDLAAVVQVDELVVMAPGLNNSGHTGARFSNDMSETLYGWGFLTHEGTDARDVTTVFNDAELLLIRITPKGATLVAKQWGGAYTVAWPGYVRQDDPKVVPTGQLDELQPVIAGMLSRQSKDLFEQIQVGP